MDYTILGILAAVIVQTGGIVGWFFMHLGKRDEKIREEHGKDMSKVEARIDKIEEMVSERTSELSGAIGQVKELLNEFKMESLRQWSGLTNTLTRIADRLDFKPEDRK